MKKPKPRIIELVKPSYQPTKAKKEEEFSLDFPADLTEGERFERLTRSVVQPVNIRWIDKPRSRR